MDRYSIEQGTLTNENNSNYDILFLKGSLTINATIADPSASAAERTTFNKSGKVTLTSSVSRAKIYYTLNGNNPTITSLSIISGGAVTISKNSTLKFMVIAPNYVNSNVITRNYSVKSSVPNSKAVPKSKKNLKKNAKIKLTAPKGVTLYYTTNKSNPTIITRTKVSPSKSKNIRIAKNTELRVIAVNNDCNASDVIKRTYKLKK